MTLNISLTQLLQFLLMGSSVGSGFGSGFGSDSRALTCVQVIGMHTLTLLPTLPIDGKSHQAFLTFSYNA